ncbi:MAG: hypothetical protein EOP36_00395 [Rubrivivax sp.]|nr:MAG: hypothetical protein EOP36_00395 [Rubrivivax sp.]
MSNGSNQISGTQTKKDLWDKLDASSGVMSFISAIAIALVGGAFTLVFKATEERRAELEVSEKMLGHLVKGDRETEGALALMTALSRCDVAAQMARLFGGKETIESMKRLATSTSSEPCKVLALEALEKLSNQGTIEEARAAVSAKAAVTSATAPPSAPQIQEFIVTSGQKPSGPMKSYSEPYALCAELPRDLPGYKIVKSDFRLVGDRSCGAWAECNQTVSTESKVCWQFKLQGHDELPPPGIGTSEGVLRVTAQKS